MKLRRKPCLCCSCPECGAVFFAAAMKVEYFGDNRNLLLELADYASQGYNIEAKNVDEFEMKFCEHLKTT